MALAVVAIANLAVGLTWAGGVSSPGGQAATVRVCEANDPVRCDGADARLQHTGNDPNLGFSMMMGYLNGDGFIDLAVGAPNEDRVYVFYGAVEAAVAAEGVLDRSTDVSQADLILQGDAGSEFGYSLAIGPDGGMASLNNPMIVGAPRWTDGTITQGRAYSIASSFWSGSPAGITMIGAIGATTFTGEADADEAGYAVGIGPVLTAGAADRIVTARLANGGVGAIYAIAAATGSIDLSAANAEVSGSSFDADANALTNDIDEGLGEFVAIADFAANGGVHEVAVGAVGVNGTDVNNIPGHVYIFDMTSAPATADAAHRIEGSNPNDFFGFSLAAGQLFAGAGPELAVGAIYADRDTGMCALGLDRTNVGAVYVFDSATVAVVASGMGPSSALNATTTYRGQHNWDEFGFSLAVGNADHASNQSDLAISARRHDRDQTDFNQVDEGAVYVLEGPLAAGELCMDCLEADCAALPVATVVFGGDYSSAGVGASDEIGFSIAFGDFNGGDVMSPAGRLFDDLAISSVTQERVYLVSLRNADNPPSDGANADNFRDIEDRDDDGDGYLDTDEDENQNGVVDAGESDPLTPNRDATVSISTNSGGNNLDCDGEVEVRVTVTNASSVLTLLDPRLSVTLPNAPFEYVPGSTEIYFQGAFVSTVNDNAGPALAFAGGARAITQTGAARTTNPIAPGGTLEVRFRLRVALKLSWALAQINSDDVDATVSLVAPDFNELPYPHNAGISQINSASLTINLRRPNLDITKAFFLFAADTNGQLNPANNFRYAITITNNGNLAATNVLLTDLIPANATINSAVDVTIQCPTCVSTPASIPAVNPVVVTLDRIDPGRTAVVRFQLTADEDLANNDMVTNQATVAETCLVDRVSDSADAGDNDNADSGNGPADLNDDDINAEPVVVVEAITLSGSANPNPAVVGNLVTYTYQATTGGGTVRLNNVTLTHTDPMNPAKCLPASTPTSGDNGDGFLDWAETGGGAETWTFVCTYTIQGTDPVSPPLFDSSVHISATTPQGNTVNADFNNQVDIDNTNPVANDDPSATADYNQIIEIDVLANDTDANSPSGDLIDILSVDATTALGGSAAIVACSGNPMLECISYTTPADTGSTSDTFQYIAQDLNGGTNSATVTVAIGAEPTLSISNVSMLEGSGGGDTSFIFVVTLSGNTGRFPVTVDADAIDGTATIAANDFNMTSPTLMFSADTAGPQMMNVTVPVDSDNDFELDEMFSVVLSMATHAAISGGTGIGTILNDDGVPALSIDDVSLVEGDAGQTNMVFTVSLAGSTSFDFSVDYATTDGSAEDENGDNDYLDTSGTLNFTAGTGSLTISVPINGDMVQEPDENFTVTISNVSPPPRATIFDADGVGTIKNDELSLSINNMTTLEGAAGTTAVAFDVTLSGSPTGYDVMVDWGTADGTAQDENGDGDYASTGGTLTFLDGTATLIQQVMVLVNGDTTDEADELFNVNLVNEVNAVITTASGVGTIRNDDLSLSIDDISLVEGDAGTTNADFTVTLSASPNGHDVTVDWSTLDGSAEDENGDGDYASDGATLTFLAGTATLTQTVTVLVSGDMVDEADEMFDVVLSNAANSIITTSNGTATIQNDDLNLVIGDFTTVEGDAGQTAFDFIVTLSASPSGHAVNVLWGTVDGNAEDENGDGDYTSNSGMLTFADGTATLMQTVTVMVDTDTKFETDELFNVALSGVDGAILADASADGTITNDDAEPTISISDVTQAEGDALTSTFQFMVSLSNTSYLPVSMDFTTTDGGATVGDGDYTAASASGFTIAAGSLSNTIDVLVNGDTKFELDDGFTVDLSAPLNATFSDSSGAGTITNDDAAPTIDINSPSVLEGDAGTVNLTFNVTLSNASYLPVSMDFATANGAGPDAATIADNDYLASSGTAGGMTDLVIAPGGTAATLDVTINGDLNVENDETFTMTLSNPINATFNTSVGTGTILTELGGTQPPLPQPDFVGFDQHQLRWLNVTGVTSYHVYRGDLAVLKSTGVYTQDTATVAQASQFCWSTGDNLTDSYAPPVGSTVFYLITSDDGLRESELGSRGDGALRPNHDPCR